MGRTSEPENIDRGHRRGASVTVLDPPRAAIRPGPSREAPQVPPVARAGKSHVLPADPHFSPGPQPMRADSAGIAAAGSPHAVRRRRPPPDRPGPRATPAP